MFLFLFLVFLAFAAALEKGCKNSDQFRVMFICEIFERMMEEVDWQSGVTELEQAVNSGEFSELLEDARPTMHDMLDIALDYFKAKADILRENPEKSQRLFSDLRELATRPPDLLHDETFHFLLEAYEKFLQNQ